MRAGSGFILGGALMMLAGCDGLSGMWREPIAPPPPPRPAPVEEISPQSAALQAYYQRIETGHRTRGLLRSDGGGPDVLYDANRVVNTFMTVAFQREFSDLGATLVRRERASLLHRWADPVRIEPIFGASIPEAQRRRDQADIQGFAARLSRITGHPIQAVSRRGNFRVLVLSEEERQVAGPLLTRLIPGIRRQDIALIEALPQESYCIVIAADAGNEGTISRAVAVIRAELPPLLRLSCIHEELAQGLGLANDSANARPSIFNDDDEFGRLTSMDELMLGMLYDQRLVPGMSAVQARPIVETIANAYLGGAS